MASNHLPASTMQTRRRKEEDSPYENPEQTNENEGEDRSILFLHGFLGAGDDWDELASLLPSRAIAPDSPGHGESVGLPRESYSMEGAARRTLNALDEAGTKRCHLVGYSMGGRLALYLALRHPERFASLTLESASPGLKTDEERAARRESDKNLARRLEASDKANFHTFLEEWHLQPLFASLSRYEGLVGKLISKRLDNDPKELAKSLRGMGTGSQPNLWDELPNLEVPTLAVAGELDGKFTGTALEMSASSPNVESVIVPEAGHNVHIEKPGEFAGLLKRRVVAG